MTKSEAKIIANAITNEQMKQMLDAAKNGIKDWTVVSKVNKGMTKGAAWNILGKNFEVDKSHHFLYKYNAIREFSEFLPEELRPKKKPKPFLPPPVHQDPIFD